MAIRKILTSILIASTFLIFLLISMPEPTAAQEPDPPPKGADVIPNTAPTDHPSTATSTQIDPALLRKIEPQLLKKLIDSTGETIPFIVYLKTQADLSAAIDSASAGLAAQVDIDPMTKRTIVVNALQQTARDTQGGVLQLLQSSSGSGGLSGQSAATSDIKPFWIINAVAAKGSLETVLALAAQPEVQIVRFDKKIQLNRPAPPSEFLRINTDFPQSPHLQTPEWGISKIRADLVHDALGIDGAGVVVANIDTGVDWLHPALKTKYRGYTGEGHLPLHTGNWFDATGGGATYPVDGNGHGTHTMGTMVGDGGIGVAPGARWIAVRTFDSSGSAQNSWLHDAFQWILAPNGDPALAPDIVNNSWGSSFGGSTEFEADVQALLNAGIYPVFSAGNSGPNSGTVGSPGSLTISFAVGATTIDDEIANFSSRGPSPWGVIKPEVSAPGKDVRSSLPGGTYAEWDGTSMAAPHASGLAALLLQASPTLSNNLADISNVMQATAIDLGSPGQDNNFGWGRIDAYNAVMSVASAGALQGVVADSSTSNPISNALIQMTPTLSGPTVNTTSDGSGAYIQGLAPNTYNVTASAFGYQPDTVPLVDVMTNTTTVQDFQLAPSPTGTLAGTVKDKISNAPLAATVSIDGAPASVNTNPADGSYSLQLPVGVYTATVVAAQHRVTKAVSINIADGVTTTQNFLLDSAPSILLVDSGRWYQESQIDYYRQALDDQLYHYDVWSITKPFDTPNDIPTSATLSGYDVVIWSSPLDSPGYIGADDELSAFLNSSGKLLLSGQDIAYYDGGGSPFILKRPYLEQYLKTAYVQDNSGISTVSGEAGQPFAGLSLSLSGGDGADNQNSPDVIANADADFAGPLLNYDTDKLAALHIGTCVPYRALFFSFGFESINSQVDRSQVMGQTIDWLMQLPATVGVELIPAENTVIGNFGTTASHPIRVRNTGTSGDEINLNVSSGSPYNWTISGIPASVLLTSCQSQTITATIQIPAAKSWHISDTFTLLAQSTTDGAVTDIATRTTKTPAPVLLVDDDRWYSFADEFKQALADNNIPYDYYFVPKSWTGAEPPSPPLETLQMYPMTVWYTAYDWFQPLLPSEEDRLESYLDGGGRLFFCSQDFLYRHLIYHGGSYDTFAQDYMGILAHTEDYSTTTTIGQAGNPVGTHLGPYSLTFPLGYNNWTDALTPTATAQIATRGQVGQPNGLINRGTGSGDKQWHTVFLAYGPELLASGERARLMQRSVGWLSWLGSSTIQAEAGAVTNGSLITYTATLTNNGWDPISGAVFTATFPAILNPVSASPGVSLSGGNFVWSDSLNVNESKTFYYTAEIVGNLSLGTVISQTSWLYYPEHNILFDRITDVSVSPNLETSSMSVSPNTNINVNDILNYTIRLKNSGPVESQLVTTTNSLPAQLELVGVGTPGSGAVISSGNSFTWTTSLVQDQETTLGFQARVTAISAGGINNVAQVNDGVNPPFNISAVATFKVLPTYLPLILKN